MYTTIRSATGTRQVDAVAVLLNQRALPSSLLKGIDPSLRDALTDYLKRPECSLDVANVARLYPDKATSRLLPVSVGDSTKPGREACVKAAAALVKACAAAGVTSLRIHADHLTHDALQPQALAQAIGEGLEIGRFTFDTFKGAATTSPAKSKASRLTVQVDKALRSAFDRGLHVGAGTNLARELAATPPNIATPTWLIDRCRDIASESKLTCTVIDAARARKLNMGGLLAVGAGSDHKPAIVCLEWNPRPRKPRPRKNKTGTKGRKKDDQPIMLVGKAVTFDTGGYSLKPREAMTGMKYDKCGGTAVIGAMHAAAALKLPQRIVGLIAIAENMIDEDAFRVDDILTMHNGVTVEVTNTDAEGRLILADALSYGCRTYKPSRIVDLATLTGGVAVALGRLCAGLFTSDAKLEQALLRAGEASGERLWALPLWKEHRDMLKSRHADIVNSAGRDAHAIQGAAFLSHFVGETGGPDDWASIPWAHLDIANVATTDKDSALFATGPTGFGVRLLLQWLSDKNP